MKEPLVCIIGAGSAGIAAAKTLKQQGIAFHCYEKGSAIGGVWRYKNDNGLSAAYKTLHINTNRNIMAYSDFPMPADYPMFPHHSHIISYFEAYAKHFGIIDEIIYNTSITKVEQDTSGEYLVSTDKGETKKYSYVIVANGHHWNPRMPEPAFKGTFTGESIHSHDYKEAKQVEGKNVLIVGIGNSGVDIACEAARTHTGKVVISTRSGAHIVPNWVWSKPFDSFASPLTSKLPLAIQRVFLQILLWLARGKQSDYGVPVPKRPVLSEHPKLSQDLLGLAGRGMIGFKPNISHFEGKTVHFEDGTSEEFDMIVYATGYKVTFPFLKHIPAFDVEENNNIGLYKRIIHPDHQNLFFLGLIQPLGAIMPLAEIQAKWIAKYIKGEIVLPNKDLMQKKIVHAAGKMASRYKKSARHTLQVDFHTYKSEIEQDF